MTAYGPGEAREWALAHLRGCCGCLLPTFTADLSAINEAAIRADVALEKRLGMAGILIVSECGTTLDELTRVTEMAVDEAGGELHVLAHASLGTAQLNRELVRRAEAIGVDGVLVSYPMSFHPATEDDVLDYTRAVTDGSDLGVVLFAMWLWDFRRLHPSDFAPDLIGRMLDELPNVMAVKNEIGLPGMAGIAQLFERYRERVVITDPLERNAPLWQRAYGMRWMGTSNYEAMAGEVPRIFALLQEDRFEEAMERYWRVHPIRQADATLTGEAMAGTALVHRLMWKYQGWLHGFNGGPIRGPHMRLHDRQMRVLRAAVQQAGLPVTADDDADFFVGRHPA